MGPEMEFRGGFEIPAKSILSPNNWYLGFACSNCTRLFAVLDDPTESGAIKAGGSATFKVACPDCGEAAVYPADRLQVFRAPSSRSTTVTDEVVPGIANG